MSHHAARSAAISEHVARPGYITSLEGTGVSYILRNDAYIWFITGNGPALGVGGRETGCAPA